jgi:hypothetical protein
MNKLKQLDELILEAMREKNLIERDTKKGGIESKKKTSGSTKNLGLDMGELVSILVGGTESGTELKSYQAAAETLMKTFGSEGFPDLSSVQNLVNSFSFFDLNHEKAMTEKCSSLGSLVSKYALTGGLISIFEQFNASAGGFVNEAYLAMLLGGQAVPPGQGGIEDFTVGDVAISLKTKKKAEVGGSLTQLVESLGIPYYIKLSKNGGYSIPSVQTKQGSKYKTLKNIQPIPGTEDFLDQEQGVHYFKPSPMKYSHLYYLFFSKKESKGESARGLRVLAAEITEQDLITGVPSIERDGIRFYNLSEIKNIIAGSVGILMRSVKNAAAYDMAGDYSVEGYNNVLKENAGEVFESLKTLDQWFGDLKVNLMSYVSSLEKSSFDNLQEHLTSGAGFAFKAFDIGSCKESS